MKKYKLSSKFQDYFWGVVFTISGMLFVWIVSLFA